MAVVLSPAKIRRNQRTAKIIDLAGKHRAEFDSKSLMYDFIAKKVGCHPVTVWRTLKDAEL